MHLIAVWIGSPLQFRVQKTNAHAHLSDVGDAITLDRYFTSDEPNRNDRVTASRAVAAIIYRILLSSQPGPNSRARLQALQIELARVSS